MALRWFKRRPIHVDLAVRVTNTVRVGETYTIRTTSMSTPDGAVVWRTQLRVEAVNADQVEITSWDERFADDVGKMIAWSGGPDG